MHDIAMQNHSTPSQITPFSSKARAELGELHTDMYVQFSRTHNLHSIDTSTSAYKYPGSI